MTKIDTTWLLNEVAQTPITTNGKPSIPRTLRDELVTFIQSHTPFTSRAEVEEYLKGKDWKVEVGEDDGCSCCGNGKNKDTKAVRGDKTIYIFACDLCMYGDAFKISVSILTPALLDAILEAK